LNRKGAKNAKGIHLREGERKTYGNRRCTRMNTDEEAPEWLSETLSDPQSEIRNPK